jgi:diaminohydroxyphosphoribosylaminopyrimidine deaminase / 5-amino-6-(5-phosphoribosylamino)uracil reductase
LGEEAAWALLLALRGSPPPSGRWEAPGPLSPQAQALVELHLPLVLSSRMVIGQMGQSLDGRIATETGHSHYVTGPEDIRRLHRVRALVDAVVVGAGTVASDDPRLTVREVEGPDPVRVILDPKGRLSPKHRVFTHGVASDGTARTLWIQRGGTKRHGAEAWEGGERLFLPTEGPLGFHPGEVVALLADRGLHRVLVEGGGITVSRFLQAGALDRLHITVAPLLIGSGRPGISLHPIETLDEALRPACRIFALGKDTLFDLDLREG